MASKIDTERNEMECEVGDATFNRPKRMKIFDWLSDYEFYMTASVFVASRLFLSLSQSYMPFYILYTLRLSSEYVAIIPLVTFVSGLIFSTCLSTVKKRIGLRGTFCISCIIATGNNCIYDKLHPSSICLKSQEKFLKDIKIF